MSNVPNTDFVKQKAREISYALIRVCFYIKRQDLKLIIEKSSFELLDKSARLSADYTKNNLNEARAVISSLDGLIRLGYSIYEIEPVNATILVRELDGLDSAIRQFGNLPFNEEALPDIDNFFSKTPNAVQSDLKRESVQVGKTQDSINVMDFSLDGPVEREEVVVTSAVAINNTSLNAAMRQSAIINKIKSTATRKLKDLLTEFPEVSERTLRYDLQRLCGQGVIERVGNGGPASYYKMLN